MKLILILISVILLLVAFLVRRHVPREQSPVQEGPKPFKGSIVILALQCTLAAVNLNLIFGGIMGPWYRNGAASVHHIFFGGALVISSLIGFILASNHRREFTQSYSYTDLFKSQAILAGVVALAMIIPGYVINQFGSGAGATTWLATFFYVLVFVNVIGCFASVYRNPQSIRTEVEAALLQVSVSFIIFPILVVLSIFIQALLYNPRA